MTHDTLIKLETADMGLTAIARQLDAVPLDSAVLLQDIENLSGRGSLLGIHLLAAVYEMLNLLRALLGNPAHPTYPASRQCLLNLQGFPALNFCCNALLSWVN